MATHGDERSPAALDRTSTRAMVEKGEGSDGWSEQQGMAPQRGKTVVGRSSTTWQWRPRPRRPRQQSGGGRRRARGSARESQRTWRARALSLEEQGVRQRVAQSLDMRQPWWGALRCMAATTPFRRTCGARDGARLGVCFRHIPCTFRPWRQ